MHNAREWRKNIHLDSFDFPRQQKLFCVIFFLCLILTKKNKRARKIYQHRTLHYLNEVNQKKFIDCHTWLQTRARSALRSKHFQWLKQKFFEQEYLIQFCFIINCSVKYFGRLCIDAAFVIAA